MELAMRDELVLPCNLARVQVQVYALATRGSSVGYRKCAVNFIVFLSHL